MCKSSKYYIAAIQAKKQVEEALLPCYSDKEIGFSDRKTSYLIIEVQFTQHDIMSGLETSRLHLSPTI